MASALVAGGLVVGTGPMPVAAAPGTITGTVFRDFNADGFMNTTSTAALPAIDVGVGGVTVTAYDATGAVVGTATTSSAAGTLGQYSLTHTATSSRVRVEFTVPSGWLAGPHGTGSGIRSGTSVQFVADNATNVNFGIMRPGDYAQANPVLVTPTMRGLRTAGANPTSLYNEPSLFAVNYTTTGAPGTGTGAGNKRVQARIGQTGQLWGIGDYGTGHVFAGTFFRRHAAVKDAADLGQIYLVPVDAGTPNPTVFVTIPDAGASPRPAGADDGSLGTYDWFHDLDGFDGVFKLGLGDVEVSFDESTLYAVNLNDRQLYSIEIIPPATPGGAPTAGTLTAHPMPLALPGAATGCDEAWVRPFALETTADGVYAGLTCTGPTDDDLRSYVYLFDEVSDTFGTLPVFEMALGGYVRGDARIGQTPGTWHAWVTTFDFNTPGQGAGGVFGYEVGFPQPLLTDIAFDHNGDMTLAIRDRFGDQSGHQAGGLDPAIMTLYLGMSAGDILRACATGPASWALESNGSCGGRAGSGVGNNEGPGGGEFYADAAAGFHEEAGSGALLQVPGFPDIVTTQFDPNNEILTNGYRKLRNSNGTIANGTRLSADANGEFGKAASLGDIEALIADAPVEIGNRVWFDADLDGIQDADELPIAGVVVSLYLDGSATPAATATTDNNGNYYFSSATGTSTASDVRNVAGLVPGASYRLEVAPNQSIAPVGATHYTTTGGTLPVTLTVADNDATPDGDIRDSDGDQATGSTTTFTIAEPGANNHSHDFGYAMPLSLGNFVWIDDGAGANFDNGVKDLDEAGIDGVTVTLLDSGGTPIATTTTTDGGYYRFDDLAPGTYSVRVDAANFQPGGPLERHSSSTGSSIDYTTAGNNRDHGIDTPDPAATGVVSAPVLLGGTLPIGEAEPGATGAGTNGPSGDPGDNLTVDFGFVRRFSLGNRVWEDTGPGTAFDNGVLDDGESPLANVVVELLDGSGNPYDPDGAGPLLPLTTTTDVNGYYRFDDLPAGDYQVRIAPANFAPGGVLDGYQSSTGASSDFTPTGNNRDHGVDAADPATTGITSGTVTLGPVVTGELDPGATGAGGNGPTGDSNDNLTVDFGLVRYIDLTIDKTIATATPGPYQAGSTVEFELVVTNNGPTVALPGFVVTDRLPLGLSYAAVQPVSANWTCSAPVGADISCTWTGAPLAAGASSTPVTIRATVDTPVTLSSARNVAYVAPNPSDVLETIPVGTPDPFENGDPVPGPGNPSNNDDAVAIDLDTYDLALAKVAVTSSVHSNGDVIEWTIRVKNQGTLESGDFEVTDRLPSGTALAAVGACSPACVDNLDGTVTWSIGDSLAPGDFVDITLRTVVTDIMQSPFRNWAEITADDGDDDDSTPDSDIGFDDTLPNDPYVSQILSDLDVDGPPGPEADQIDSDDNDDAIVGRDERYALGNRVWFDTGAGSAYNNGVLDDGELPVAGVEVALFAADGTPALDADGVPVAPQTTDANGYYRFDNLAIGDYYVLITAANFQPGGPLETYVSSTPTNSSFTAADDDTDHGINAPDPGTTGIRSATLNPAADTPMGEADPGATGAGANSPHGDDRDNLTVDFGFVQAYAVGDVVWWDLDRNGVQDPGEPGVPNVGVELQHPDGTPVTDVFGEPVLPTVTDEDGHYVFDGVPPGEYIVVFTPPSGTVFTPPSAPGSTSEDDSNATPDPTGVGVTPPFIVGPGAPDSRPVEPDDDTTTAVEINPTIDAGLVPVVAVGDYTWVDADRDGVQDPDEAPLPGVTVELFNADGSPATHADGTPVAPVVTDVNGYYLFDSLLPGDYQIQFTLPSGYRFTTTGGGSSATDSNPDPATGRTPVFTIGAAVGGDTVTDDDPATVAILVNPTIDAGVVPIVSVGDYTWLDTNRDGVQDAGEPALPGVTVELLNPDGSPATHADGTPVAPAVTDASGHYAFDDLVPGDYRIRFTPPGDLLPSPTGGGGSAVDSNPDGSGLTPVFTIGTAPGGDTRLSVPADGVGAVLINPTIDAGFFQRRYDLVLEKTYSSRDATNRTITWLFTVTNAGPDAALGPITVIDELPAGLSFVSASGDAACSAAGGTVTCVRGDGLATGTSFTFSIVTGYEQLTADITNTANVSGGGAGETTTANNVSAAVAPAPPAMPPPTPPAPVPTTDPPQPGELPATGADSDRLLAWATLSVLLGLGAVVTVRRRRHPRPV